MALTAYIKLKCTFLSLWSQNIRAERTSGEEVSDSHTQVGGEGPGTFGLISQQIFIGKIIAQFLSVLENTVKEFAREFLNF